MPDELDDLLEDINADETPPEPDEPDPEPDVEDVAPVEPVAPEEPPTIPEFNEEEADDTYAPQIMGMLAKQQAYISSVGAEIDRIIPPSEQPAGFKDSFKAQMGQVPLGNLTKEAFNLYVTQAVGMIALHNMQNPKKVSKPVEERTPVTSSKKKDSGYDKEEFAKAFNMGFKADDFEDEL